MAGKVIFLPALRETIFRVLGTLAGVGLGIMGAIWEAVLTPLHIGSIRSPAAVIAAVLGNAAIVFFTYFVTRRLGLALLPGAAWLIVMFLATYKTSEGDLIVTGTWVGALTFFLGCLGWAASGYTLIIFRAASGRAKPNRLLSPSTMSPPEPSWPPDSAGKTVKRR